MENRQLEKVDAYCNRMKKKKLFYTHTFNLWMRFPMNISMKSSSLIYMYMYYSKTLSFLNYNKTDEEVMNNKYYVLYIVNDTKIIQYY